MTPFLSLATGKFLPDKMCVAMAFFIIIFFQVAIAFHNMREVDQAVQYFKQLSNIDPYRLDNLDTYSNLLYVKEQRIDLAHLAHKTVQVSLKKRQK